VRTNYVLIDYESVQPASVAVLEQECFKVIIFVGEKQAKVSIDVAASLQRLGAKAEYIRMAGSGPNALDFHIAFYIGRLSTVEPGAYFHIISKDTGFDPLIAHLKEKKIFAARSKDVTDIPIVRTSNAKSPLERQDAIVAKLRQLGTSKPRAIKTLSSTINSIFQKSLSEGEISALIDSLKQKGYISVSGTKVTYALPE
jgi:hypothetical protein